MTCATFPSLSDFASAVRFGRCRRAKAPWAKPLKGYGGSGVVEIVDDHDGDTYRAVYTVRFAGVVYVLHAFQKKSKSGIATPKRDLALIDTRLRRAEEDYRQWRTSETKTR